MKQPIHSSAREDHPSRVGGGASLRFLPTTRDEMRARGWNELDILLISGDGYIDHPSFGIPLLGRLLEDAGYRVGIIAQPDWRHPESVKIMGRPRLFCGISAGCIDSMLAHYTAFRKMRHDDAYTPGGKAGARPNRAVIVYTSLVRSAFPRLKVVIGGIEASLRRVAHYDFWSDSLRRSILVDSKADLLVYGMGELQMVEIARRLSADPEDALTGIAGTCRMSKEPAGTPLPSYEEILNDHRLLLKATKLSEEAVHSGEVVLSQRQGDRYLIVEKAGAPLTSAELDHLYELPFTREAHPGYNERIPALDTVKWSITAMRGCAGGCSFCSLALHQSRHLSSRSADSIIRESIHLTRQAGWRGSISDIGGPTANLWQSRCRINGRGCRRSSCLEPSKCPNLQPSQEEYLQLLRRVQSLPGVRHVDIASGIRHDLALLSPGFVEALVSQFVGGHLKLAPEHRSARVLKLMRKCDFRYFEDFCDLFGNYCRKYSKEQYVVPYVMSAFPGCTMEDMHLLVSWFRQRGWSLEQSQCFIPTPGTMATAMYYAEAAPDGTPLYVAKSDRERMQQHAVMVGAFGAPAAANRRPSSAGAPVAENRRPSSAGTPAAANRRGQIFRRKS